ncbi:hypothetical protein AORI_8032 [Amycolatopsis keratiniphila]|uniref:Uncharacterized protein n=1 Tax=Amycolatopsis keratiniphila TaxID=129921 RepID=R4TKD7_9PSEU|nr:hypothetical protein AORI_8032 [Amycolatopsis keratiniphila]
MTGSVNLPAHYIAPIHRSGVANPIVVRWIRTKFTGELSNRRRVRPCADRLPENGAWTTQQEPVLCWRAKPAAGRGLRLTAARAAQGRPLRTGRHIRRLRRGPVPPAGREIPRPTRRAGLPGLSSGGTDPGVLGVRRRAQARRRIGQDTGGTDADGRALRGVHRLRSRGLPELSLEPPGAVLRPRNRRTGNHPATDPVAEDSGSVTGIENAVDHRAASPEAPVWEAHS